MKTRHYDIAIISDFRQSGGEGLSIVECVKAQAAAGYTTALIHRPSFAMKRDGPFNRPIIRCIQSGLADLVPIEQPLTPGLLIIRSTGVFGPDFALPRWIKPDVSVLVVNHPPFNLDKSRTYYDVAALQRAVGRDCLWAPNGPLVRKSLKETGVSLNITDEDWYATINVDEWETDRSSFVADRPVIGRHSRDAVAKWPESSKEILAAYPDNGQYIVRILGGAKVPEHILGRLPANWEVYPFNAISPARFLQKIDFFVYFHHPLWVEAFGRVIIEALASGVPAIVPPHFESLYKDACIYARPEEVPDLVSGLYGDRQAYLSQSSRGVDFVREQFGPRYHTQKIRDLIGGPSASPFLPPTVRRKRKKKVLFVSSNGVGMGHLVTTMAIAKRLSPDVQPVFLTMSVALAVLRQEGFFAEYFPGRHQSSWNAETWNHLLGKRIREAIQTYDPGAVVLDSVSAYRGLVQVAKSDPERPFIWSRRGMWKEAKDERLLADAPAFDLVIEPGELAEAFDAGPTASQRQFVTRVEPIVCLDESDLLERAEAARELGLDPNRPAVMIQLGTGGESDITLPVKMFLQSLAEVPGLQIVVGESVILDRQFQLPAAARKVSIYPLSKYLRMFDFVVSAAGYNSFHELIRFGVPAIFVPMVCGTDDQASRARYARETGAGLCLEAVTRQSVDACLKIMMDPDKRKAMSARCREVFPGNGAEDAARVIEDLILRWPELKTQKVRERSRCRAESRKKGEESEPETVLLGKNLRKLATRLIQLSKRDFPRALKNPLWAFSGLFRILFRTWKTRNPKVKKEIAHNNLLIVACGMSQVQLEKLLKEIHTFQLMFKFKPVFVTDRDCFHLFRRYDCQFEYIPPESEWSKHMSEPPWDEFSDRRFRSIVEAYQPDRIIALDDSNDLPALKQGLLNAFLQAAPT